MKVFVSKDCRNCRHRRKATRICEKADSPLYGKEVSDYQGCQKHEKEL